MISDCARLNPANQCADTPWSQDNLVPYRAEPNCGRGTAGIVWNCLTVMVFSAWSVIHIDTRPFSRPKAGLFWKPWNKLLRKDTKRLESTSSSGPTARKLFEAFTNLLFPEYGVLKAVEELVIARFIQYNTKDIDGWKAFSIKQAHLVRMGGISVPYISQPEDFPQFVSLSARVLKYDRFPSDKYISLRAKRDFFDKVVAISQVVYFLSALTTRSRQSYRISVMELITLNYIALASVTFLLRLRKPQELYEPFELDLAELPSPTLLPRTDGAHHSKIERWIWAGTIVAITVANLIPFATMPGRKDFWATTHSKSPEGYLTILSLVGLTAIVTFMLRRRLEHHQWNRDTLLKTCLWYLSVFALYCCGLGYVGARIYLWFMTCTNLVVVREGVYLMPTSWTGYLAHVGA